MAPNQRPDDVALAQLRIDFPGHRIWRSARSDGRLGDWVASLHDPAEGIDPTVICSDSSALRSALTEEKRQAEVRNEDR